MGVRREDETELTRALFSGAWIKTLYCREEAPMPAILQTEEGTER